MGLSYSPGAASETLSLYYDRELPQYDHRGLERSISLLDGECYNRRANLQNSVDWIPVAGIIGPV